MDVFENLKILDFTWVIIGPLVTKFLAEHGAEVIKIEAPTIEHADLVRSTPPFKDNIAGFNRSGYFNDFNSNKYSISIDLSHSLGKEVARRLIEWADVVVENFSPGIMDKLGFGYNELCKIKRDIIMISLSMQGQKGPRSRQPGLGLQLVVLNGFTNITGWPDREPAAPYSAYTDFIGHYYAAAALIAALRYRRRTGKGQYIDVSQYETGIQFIAPMILDYKVNKILSTRRGNRSDCGAPHGIYRCKGDDRWCAIAVFTESEWKKFCRVIGNPAWTGNPGFSSISARLENSDELDILVEEWTEKYSSEDIMTAMQAAGVKAGIVETGQDLHKDPHLKERKFFQTLNHREIGHHSYRRLPFKLSRTPGRLRLPAPCLGQDTEYVCTHILGMTDEEFVRLFKKGAVGRVPD